MQKDQERFAGLEVHYTKPQDGFVLKEWLSDPDGGCWFPIDGELELDDAVMRWIAFHRYQCSITVTKGQEICGIATLYLQPYQKLVHQCEFGIIVGKKYRHQKIGHYLLNCLIHLAKEKFAIEVLHLQVYANNPAIQFYKKFGFKEFGRQENWSKDENGSHGRVFMEKRL